MLLEILSCPVGYVILSFDSCISCFFVGRRPVFSSKSLATVSAGQGAEMAQRGRMW
jgi:hypothetical protein